MYVKAITFFSKLWGPSFSVGRDKSQEVFTLANHLKVNSIKTFFFKNVNCGKKKIEFISQLTFTFFTVIFEAMDF